MIFFQDSRVSITLLHTGCAYGITVPTVFVLNSKRQNGLFTDEFLRSKVFALGSIIIIIGISLMINTIFASCTEHLMNFCRNSEVVKDNPD